jgi:hypothetical protein
MAPVPSSKAFGDCLQTNFAVDAPGGSATLVLLEVQEGPNSRKMDSFSLLFRGPIAPFFPQAIYRVHHETLGSIELFLAPMGPDRHGMQYEAVFNRFPDPQ